jgi:uncharacterized protein
MTDQHFWKTKTLREMSPAEWESLCDGCGKCCLVKFNGVDPSELFVTDLHCKMFDAGSCRCSDYANRTRHVPDCVPMTPEIVETTAWLPDSCAYRLVNEGRDLPDWHHLVSGDRGSIHLAGQSCLGRTRNELDVPPAEIRDHVIDWYGRPARRRRKKWW